MRLWWLERIGAPRPGERVYVLVFAHDEGEARVIADTAHLAEGPIWTDPREVTCKEVVPGPDPEIITLGRLATDRGDVFTLANSRLSARAPRGEMPCP